MRRVGQACLALHQIPQPVIAKVGGVAAGAGLNLALGCDIIVASDDARFSEIFAKRGLTVDFGGSWLLPRLVGLHKAKELVLLADIIDAAQARDLGLVNRVVPASELDAFVDDWARRLAAGPPLALSMSKRLLNESMAMSLDQALEAEALAQNVNFTTKDTTEAMLAFVEKREPRFEGR
jgi:2-(1,2-epoxy-1,2-dihydrophenyl)acetyl-CoA isomerase